MSACLRFRKELDRRVSRVGKEHYFNGEGNIVVSREDYGPPDADERSVDFMRNGDYPTYN